MTAARFTRRIHLPTRAEARTYLTQIAVDLLSGANDYFLPFEAVENLWRIEALSDASIEDAVCAIRDTGPPPPYCKSDFGPVRNAREYRVPLEEIKQGLIARRYGPLMEIFPREKKGRRAHD
jgi:hypothetical protein